MTQTLKMTKKEVDKLINNRLNTERFEEIFNDIPMYHPDHVIEKGETHYKYYEDDGRKYCWYIFKDTLTGIEHCINYTWNPDWPNDLMDTPNSIQIVDKDEDSDLYIKPEPIVEPVVILSPEKQADKDLTDAYNAIKSQCREVIPKEKLEVPKERIKQLLDLLKTTNFTIIDVRAIAYPICIEYKLEQKSFWHWIQVKRGSWKG